MPEPAASSSDSKKSPKTRPGEISPGLSSSPQIHPVDAKLTPTTTSAALQALYYDHGRTPNTTNVPPISEWEKILIGKRWIAEHVNGDENVSLLLSWLYTALIRLTLYELIDIQAIRTASSKESEPFHQ